MAEVLLLLDSDGRVTYCSDSSLMILGIRPEEVLGQALSALLANERYSDAFDWLRIALLESVQTASHGVKSVEITCFAPDGRKYQATIFPLATTQVGSMTGITLREIAENCESEERRENFVAVLSHELRDPITALMGFTRLLLESGSFNSTEQNWLETILICGQRITTISSDMLDVVALRSGNLTVNLGQANLRAVIDEVVPLVEETYNGLRCSVEIPGDLVFVIADKTRLAQVISNLLSNAAKYSPREEQVIISAEHEPLRQRVVVAVADQGAGIAPEDLRNIFNPFQRSLGPETLGVRGVGLGLYIVNGLMNMMDGEVWLESEIGRGSTFYISLPTSEDPVSLS